MPTQRILYLTLALVCLAPTIADAQVYSPRPNTQRGATLGGLAGAVAGGLIGDNNGEAGAGAAIGGVVGAVTGGLLGNAADKEAAYHQQQQLYYQHQQVAQTQTAVSPTDAISMSRSGLGDAVIINQINQRGVQRTLQVPDIISLHQQGVSEAVITAMQQAPTGAQRVARAPSPVVRPSPVIVEEHYVVPHYAPPRIYYHRPPARHHHHGIHFRF